MSLPPLFRTVQGTPVTSDDLRAALDCVRANDCSLLYMHSGLSFGLPNPALSRAELLNTIYHAVCALGVPTLCVPTFTFSFCNGQDYDVENSKSQMGALNEYIRRQPEAIRSVDPLMSVAMIGQDRDLVENLGKESIGANSTFDKLSRKHRVKFLFLGVHLGDCFTYMHHLEWAAKVPYRYNREFRGKIIQAGRTTEDTYTLFVRYHNVKPNNASHIYGRLLEQRGLMRSFPVGDTMVSCVGESEAREVYVDLLRQDPNYFIEVPFNSQQADPSFLVNNMVAL
jgi:aminoglycoside 3-N-acetyltransferase